MNPDGMQSLHRLSRANSIGGESSMFGGEVDTSKFLRDSTANAMGPGGPKEGTRSAMLNQGAAIRDFNPPASSLINPSEPSMVSQEESTSRRAKNLEF